MPRPADLLRPLPAGLYCEPGGFFIDPLRAVDRALITHAHSDHARPGHGAVLATEETLAIMALRLGAGHATTTQTLRYGEILRVGEVSVSFHPAGHVLGSAQIRLRWRGLTIVVSGDYKRQPDGTCAPFELVPCDVFVTEATFGLPVFRHPAPEAEIGKLIASRALFSGQSHLVGVYSLGKAQRLLSLLRAAGYDRPIFLHGALAKVTDYYASRGIALGDLRPVAGADKAALAGEIVLCPPSAIKDIWARRFSDPITAVASGWMRVKARARQAGAELPLIISDHVDWPELTRTVIETGASDIWVTHGQEDALVHWCGTRGLSAMPLRLVGYGDEAEENAPEPAEEAP